MNVRKLITGSFLLVMLIHITVFTGIGIFTPAGFTLLWIFLTGLGLFIVFYIILKKYAHSHPEKIWVKKIFPDNNRNDNNKISQS